MEIELTTRSHKSAENLVVAAQHFYDTTVSMKEPQDLYTLLQGEKFSGKVRYVGVKFENAQAFIRFAQSLQKRYPDIENEVLPGVAHDLGNGLVRLDAPHHARVYGSNPRRGQLELRAVFHSRIRFTFVDVGPDEPRAPLLLHYDFIPGLGGLLPTLKLFLCRIGRWLFTRR